MEWITYLTFLIIQTNTIWEHITLETVLGVVGVVAYMIGVWKYYSKKAGDAMIETKKKISEAVKGCQESCEMKNNMRFAEIESQIVTEKEQRQKTDEKLDAMDEKITDIRLSIREIETMMKSRQNGKS